MQALVYLAIVESSMAFAESYEIFALDLAIWYELMFKGAI